MKLNLVTLAAAIIILSLAGIYTSHLPWTGWRVAGIAIAAPSFICLMVARVGLGRAFSVRAKATTLVTTGIYSRIRNPIYVFGALTILGIIIWLQQPWLLLILAVLIPVQVIRSRREERALTDKFGSAYLEYKKKTWF
jgi:protein-S-isoprenylcysteine O-methyltransferase Ste14